MTSAPATSDAPFAIGDYTSAPLRLDMQVRFTNQSPATVFDVMGDPAQIQNWYVLAKDTVVDEQTTEDELQFLSTTECCSSLRRDKPTRCYFFTDGHTKCPYLNHRNLDAGEL